jgi:hypothetical protein
MPKRKTDDTESDSAKEKKEGGPLERQRSFMRQRSAVLHPREDSSSPQDSQQSGGGQSSPPDSRKQVMSEYRKRQKAARSKKQS